MNWRFFLNILDKKKISFKVEAEEIGGGHFEIYSTSLRRARSVFDQGILFLRASNPFLQKGREVTVKVGIRKGGGGQRIKCDALCDRSQVFFVAFSS